MTATDAQALSLIQQHGYPGLAPTSIDIAHWKAYIDANGWDAAVSAVRANAAAYAAAHPAPVAVTPAPSSGLPATIFGIDSKIALIGAGVLLYMFSKGK